MDSAWKKMHRTHSRMKARTPAVRIPFLLMDMPPWPAGFGMAPKVKGGVEDFPAPIGMEGGAGGRKRSDPWY